MENKYKFLIELLESTEDEIFEECKYQLIKHYGKENVIVDEIDHNYIFVEGESPIMMVAHLDIYYPDLPVNVVISEDGVMKNGNDKGCLGADDRAGAYSILRLLEEGHRPSVLFTTGEEIGGIGVKAFSKEFTSLPKHTRLLIELDRKGSEDYVDYSYRNPDEVNKYFTDHGFKTSRGSYSDVATLTSTFGIPHANLSIGYYKQHSILETLVLSEMEVVIEKVSKMLHKPIDKLYELKEEAPRPVYDFTRYRQDAFNLNKDFGWPVGGDEEDDDEFWADDPELKFSNLPSPYIDEEDLDMLVDTYPVVMTETILSMFIDDLGFPYSLELEVDHRGEYTENCYRVYSSVSQITGEVIDKKVQDQTLGERYVQFIYGGTAEELGTL